MKLGISQGNNGKLVLTADNLKFACHELGIPDDKHTLRRAARAFDLYYSDKVGHVNDHTFKVASQYNRERPYRVQIKQTPHLKALCYAYCTCQDWMNYSGDQDLPDVNFWCKHSIAALVWLHKHSNGNGNGSKITNECGSEHAKTLQDKMNGQIDSHGNNGNGAQAPSQIQLDISDPFQQSEQLDIDQIEGRLNGEYVISYKGIMTLAEKHNIEYSVSIHDDTNTVIATGGFFTADNHQAMNGNSRVSGKEIKRAGSIDTAIELAKRNAARQLLPYAELKAVEKKAQLKAESARSLPIESDFSFKKAYDKCVKLVGGKAQLDCIIYDLVNWGKLRQDNPSHYDRTEWLIIHDACKQDASNDNNDGGDKTPSSNEPNRYKVLADAPVNDNWRERHRECTKLVGFPETDLIIRQELNFRYSYYKNKITDEQWDVVLQECRYRWNARQAKAEFASAQQEYKLNHIQWKTGYDVRSQKYVGRPPKNSNEFLARCKQAIDEVRAEKKSIEANELPLQSADGKRRLQMDKKLRTWLIEADGTKKAISCREICEQFESKSPTRRPGGQNPSIVTRLRAGIDDGADISIVELDN